MRLTILAAAAVVSCLLLPLAGCATKVTRIDVG